MTTIKANVELSGYCVHLVSKDGVYQVVQTASNGTMSTLTFDTQDEAEALFSVLTNVGYY